MQLKDPRSLMRLNTGTSLVGREAECEILTNLCRRVGMPQAPSEVCLVHGAAGSGKTSVIVQSCQTNNDNNSNKGLYFVSGKFDQYQDFSSPFSEIVNAFDQLANIVMDPTASHEERQRFRNCLGTEAKILTRLIPSFEHLLSSSTEEGDHGEERESENAPTAKNTTAASREDDILTLATERLTVAFQVFLREFCTQEHPLVLFIDDLQWSDENSCRLLGGIFKSADIRNFLFVGCYREEGASAFDLDLDPSKTTITDLPIGALDAIEVDQLIGMIIDEDYCAPACTEIGHLVHRKTMGNPYFVVQFLKMLQSKELLKYNYETAKWEWASLDAIAASTDVSENVVDVLRARIGLLPPPVQRILIVASFLGFLVDLQLLEDMVLAFGTMERLSLITNTNDADRKAKQPAVFTTSQALKLAEQEGLVEISTSLSRIPTCRFSHDKIQECFYALVPAGREQEQLHYQIGMHVWRRHGESDPAYIFLAADQLNRGAGLGICDNERMFLVELNYKASLAAKSKVGIETVAMFMKKATDHVALLKDGTELQRWEKRYEMFLDMYSFAAEVEFRRGYFDSSEEHIDKVLAYARQSKDTVRALACRALAHGVRRDFVQSIRESRKLLQLLGVKMPPSYTISFLGELFKTKKALKKKSDDDILGLKVMESDDLILAMKILQHGSVFGWNSDTTFAGLCYLKMIRLTMEHGWCEVTPYAFSGYSFLLAGLGEEEEAFRFSQLALRSSKSQNALPDVNMMVYVCVAHFQRPAATSLFPLLGGYRAGLETGDMMCGSICMSGYASVYIFSGLALPNFAQDMFHFVQQLKLCHQDLALAFVLPALQLALNLTGKTKNPADISRESMSELDGFNDNMFVDTTIEDPSLTFVLYLQAFSGFVLGDLDLAERTLIKIYSRKIKRLPGTQIMNIFFILVEGLVSFELRRKKPRNKFWRLAGASIRQLESLAKKRAINCSGLLALLQAEHCSFTEKNVDIVREKYAYAIRQLSRTGFLHFTAIANERAASAMKEREEVYWSEYYLGEAASKYEEWGAVVKVESLKKNHTSIDFSESTSRPQSGALLCREKYNSKVDSIRSSTISSEGPGESFCASIREGVSFTPEAVLQSTPECRPV